MTNAMPRAVRCAMAGLLSLIALAGVSLPAAADMTYSSKATPATADLAAETAPDLGRKLGALLGRDAPAVRTRRDAGLRAALGLSRARRGPAIEYTADFVDARADIRGDAQWRCLTEALYFEARGESVRGVFAVAEVILNRVDSSAFPGSVCGVTRQGTGRKWQCQFTYYCDGRAESVTEPAAWTRMGKIARMMIEGAGRPLTRGATFYHTRAVDPYWAHVFDRTVTIGAHYFYARG